MKWKKYFICSLAFLPVLFSFIFSLPANAADLSTAYFDLNYRSVYGGDFLWKNSILYGYANRTPVYSFRSYQFTTSPITPTGNYATIHFETNIVGNSFSRNYINFVNRNQWSILVCSSTVGGTKTIQASNVNTSVTDWEDSNGYNTTLTVYGDVALSGLTSDSQRITCMVGSSDYELFVANMYNSANIYFEQNPMSILYTSNASDILLQTQINQNQIMIEGIGQTTDAVNNASQNLQNTINAQSQQQQDQYDEEKQEESQREESGNESADEMAGVFNFSIPNPFLPILSMFTDGNSCVDIPTIAGMVGSDNTQYCPWFPASVRSVLTPVIGLASSIILFGFIVGWLTGSTRGSIEQVQEVSK